MTHIPIAPHTDDAPAVVRDIQHYMRPGLLQLSSLPPLSLYVHLPWCLKKCPYCDFNSHEARGGSAVGEVPEQRYIDALMADLEAALPLIWGRSVHRYCIEQPIRIDQQIPMQLPGLARPGDFTVLISTQN